MDPHDRLTGLAIMLTASITPSIISPFACDGCLKEKLGFKFQQGDMKENVEAMFSTGFHPMDGLIRSRDDKELLILECVTKLSEHKGKRLEKQIAFYNSDKFLEIFLPPSERSEIVVFTYKEEVSSILQKLANFDIYIDNVIVWSAEIKGENYQVCREGPNPHKNSVLDEFMVSGAICDPPLREFLLSPHMPRQRLVSVLGRRILSTRVELDATEIDFDTFYDKQSDCVHSKRQIRDALRYLFILIPALGSFDQNRNKIITKKVYKDITSIKNNLNEIGAMSANEFKEKLLKVTKDTSQATLFNSRWT